MTNEPGLANAVLYNPRQLHRETLKAIFTARRPLLDRLVKDLHAHRPTHQLIVGPRGMGKTSLLRRIEIAIEDDPKLTKRLLPLTFPEEQYNVGSLGEFYLNCLDALADYLDKHNDAPGAQKVDAIVQQLRDQPEAKLVEEAEGALIFQSKLMKRQFVLLVDNLSIIIDRLDDKEKWRLREWLSVSERRPILIAATVKFVADTANYGQALYEFLQVHELSGCNTAEATAVLRELARVFKAPQVERWLDADPARLAVLNRLAGGAPRTLVMLFQLLVQGIDGPIFQELDRLLDLATPLYKARFEELPDQAQRVVDALALYWDPATRQDLESVSRIDGNAISSQLSRLAKMGVVEEVKIPGEAKTAYQIAERFFNIWYLMRASRRSRYQLRWLVEFLKAFYSADDRNKLAQRLLHTGDCEALSHGKRLLAMSQAVDDKNLQRELQNTAMYTFAKADRQHRTEIDLNDIDKDWLSTLDRLSATVEKESFILRGIEENPEDAFRYHELAVIYETETKQYLKAEEAYRLALSVNPQDTWSLTRLGSLLTENFERYAEAEALYLRAIELDPKDPWSRMFYGLLLVEAFARHDDAEAMFKLAVDADPQNAWAWYFLGDLLGNRPNRQAEGAGALRRSVELNPTFGASWARLATLTRHLGDFEGAERALRTAIPLNPENQTLKFELAVILYVNEAQDEEAESLARQVCAANPTGVSCELLATVLARKGDILESAEWFRKAVPSMEILTTTDLQAVQEYFRQLVLHNAANVGIELLEELKLDESWRPLLAALRAAGKRDRGSLMRINPEQREAAEAIYDFFMEGLPGIKGDASDASR